LFGAKPIYFLGNSHWYRPTLVLISIWQSTGYGAIIYLAALAGVNPELFDAASVDGANRFRRIIHISLPSISPMITITFILSVSSIIGDNFGMMYNFLNPAVYNVGDVISTYVYRSGILNFDLSYATAAGLFQNVIAFVLVIIANTVSKRINEYGIW
jgi:putative aldouronate transport system permease protein